MAGIPRRRGYRLHAPDSPEAEALLTERGLTLFADLDRALAELERTEGIEVRTIAGVNEDGVFGSRREGWKPDLPDACAEPFIPVLWLQVLELLGRVPKGSTARFREDGTLPDSICRTHPSLRRRRSSAPNGDNVSSPSSALSMTRLRIAAFIRARRSVTGVYPRAGARDICCQAMETDAARS